MTRLKGELKLDKLNAKFLGVCAGLANYLELKPTMVRLVFLGCMLFGAVFLIPLYFIVWWLLDENSADMRQKLMDSQAARHFRNVDYRKKLYRNTRDGKLWGVCAGLADYLELNATLVRIVFIVLVCMTGIPILFYIGALFVLEKKPLGEYDSDARSRAWSAEFERVVEPAAAKAGASAQQDSAGPGSARASAQQEPGRRPPRDHYSKRREFQYCARRFATLQERLRRIEAYVTSNRYKLNREFRAMQ